ncbi:hypothetical protein STSP2_02248 [Anaerohalosphaera lusitana]|uniref:UPF0235 protein STSP2_02248 n=1 Tax=Anaerohalosphaera lusitana TaxID=1936003 RepID=A0A1U9NMC6_9BACT|nr:DUF167 domain-containing protein [Anaerohalosphaera lusitana]AQT69063.1 hypothetical protein STSP2_02248 [Anaerohalosphaera lusitana]
MNGRLNITSQADGVHFTVKVVPGSSKTDLAGILGDMIKVKVAAPPEKGKANKCLTEFIAKLFGIRKTDVSVVAGQTNPVKQLCVSGISADKVVETFKSCGISY